MLDGQVLRKLRLDAELTQQELADKAGITQAHVAAIEGGRDVRLSTLKKLFKVLNVEITVTSKRTDRVLDMLSSVNSKLDQVLEKLENL